ncbi:hypothetical protein B0T17DRAFT_179062 [Bombardia bombarda]|uniref:Uncharacterized protein n=1 Tax=Bombardia bombarda TaxID=252184 RepID=A0AA39X8C4_9PEZI|nr:hypothetical protein B0T17DRAFT_179062 [Bombardia bombarda]
MLALCATWLFSPRLYPQLRRLCCTTPPLPHFPPANVLASRRGSSPDTYFHFPSTNLGQKKAWVTKNGTNNHTLGKWYSVYLVRCPPVTVTFPYIDWPFAAHMCFTSFTSVCIVMITKHFQTQEIHFQKNPNPLGYNVKSERQLQLGPRDRSSGTTKREQPVDSRKYQQPSGAHHRG